MELWRRFLRRGGRSDKAESAASWHLTDQDAGQSLDGLPPGGQPPSAFFGVERPDDPEDCDHDLVVWFDHIFALDHDELVWECTAFIDGLAGVDDTLRDDREVITVTGTISAESLTAELTRWWRDRLQEPDG